jgi:hypothetical protein
MPRQLPWLNKGGASRTQTKQTPKVRARTVNEIDDDFFDGTVLASSSKGKAEVVRSNDSSDDDLPDLPAEPSTPRTKARTKDAFRKKRAPSSSPPPIADYVQPQVEDMRKGVSKFDLRDDEWMMVEDEFLETAKLFTRHLHIAEYDKLKERIEAKKKEQVQAPRPVVAGSKLSVDGSMKKKAEAQEKRQRKAIQDVFASQDDEDDEDNESDQVATTFKATARNATTKFKRPPIPTTEHDPDDSDSDDLDASRPSFKHPPNRTNTSRPGSNTSSALSKLTGPKSASSTAPTLAFAKPNLPASKPRATTARKSAFDMLDEYVPQAELSNSAGKRKAPTPTKPVLSSSPVKSVHVKDEWGSGLSKETAERIAKRKAEREKERQGKKKEIKLEDIPTFLV